jgi:septum site-determining protein MinD
MGEVLTVISGKGGVGKTFVALNTAATLAKMGYDATVLEGNVTSPTASVYLGYLPVHKTINKVLNDELDLGDAVLEHHSGVKLVTCSLHVSDLNQDYSRLPALIRKLKEQTDLLVVDGAAGLGEETKRLLKETDYVLVVTNPELPAVVDALRAVKLAKGMNKEVLGVVLNRYHKKKSQMTPEEVELILETPVIAIVEEDDAVHHSHAQHMPVVHFKPTSKASKAIQKLAADLVGAEPLPTAKQSFLDWFKSLFT